MVSWAGSCEGSHCLFLTVENGAWSRPRSLVINNLTEEGEAERRRKSYRDAGVKTRQKVVEAHQPETWTHSQWAEDWEQLVAYQRMHLAYLWNESAPDLFICPKLHGKKCIRLPSMTQFCLNHRIDPAGGSGWQSSRAVRRCFRRLVRRLCSFGSRVINERGIGRIHPRACEPRRSLTVAGSMRGPAAAFCRGHVVISAAKSSPHERTTSPRTGLTTSSPTHTSTHKHTLRIRLQSIFHSHLFHIAYELHF